MLKIINLTLKFGGETLFDGLDVTVHAGHKVGIVGRNGIGKSTLFSLVQRRLQPDDGEVDRPRAWSIAHLAQDVEATDREALAWVLDGDQKLRRIEAEIATAERTDANEALARLYTDYDDAGGYTAEARAAEILNGLGFTADSFARPYAEFSGGWRIRLNLAQTLMSPSDLLLLDEPTNHLDLDALFWLESWLTRYPGTLLVIAHDRDFLDSVCTDILHLENGRGRSYRGGYTSFERQRAETLALESAVYKKQQVQAAHMQRFVDRFRSKATKARQVQSRLKALERLTASAPAHTDSPYEFGFPNPERLSNPLVSLRNGRLGYDGAAVLDDVRVDIHPGSRIGILGANGAGKSTLMKTLAGDLALVDGELVRGTHSRVGYFAQQQLEHLEAALSPLKLLEELDRGASEQRMRDYLGGWGFRGDVVKRPSETLSGGERARLVLALVAWQQPAILLLDEPTNHLDLEMRHALSIALQEYTGAMVLVSHDRELLERTVDEYLLVADGRVVNFKQNLNNYRDLVQARFSGGSTTRRKQQRQTAAERRRASGPLRKRVERLDRDIQKLTQALAKLEATLTERDVYERLPSEELNRLLAEQGEQRAALNRAEHDWLEASDALEAFAGD